MRNLTQIYLIALGALLLAAVANGQRGGRRVEASDQQREFKSPCGTADQLSKRMGGCLKEVFDLVEGRFGEPNGDPSMLEHCQRFENTAKCVRLVAKDCLTGIHKTATGAVASATRRFKQQECKTAASRAKYTEPLKCSRKKGQEMVMVYRNHTALMQGIRDLTDISAEEKLVKLCCVLSALDKDLEMRFNRDCPKSTQIVLNLVHAMTDDARSTLCVAPKCNHALDRVMNTKYQPPQSFIEPIFQILYQLNTAK